MFQFIRVTDASCHDDSLMIALRGIVEDKGWKQAEAAEVFKLSQQQVSDLLQGKIDKLSIDLLMTCLHRYRCISPISD